MDASHYRTLTVSRGLAYNVFHAPAAAGKPTLLLLHGFPGSSYDWRRTAPYLAARGLGVVAPDMLGAGGTARPADAQAFRLAAIARDVVDILDALGLAKVVGVGHDWGCVALSYLSLLHQARFAGFVWLAVGFREPATEPFDIEQAMAQAKALLGYEWYAYWLFLSRRDAGDVIQEHIDSFLQLTYAKDPATWPEVLFRRGKAAEHIEGDVLLGRADWLPQEEYDKVKQEIITHGMHSRLLWYTNAVDNNDLEENKKIQKEAYPIKVPSLFVGGSKDPLFVEAVSLETLKKYATDLKIESVDAGHYIHLERAEEVNKAIEEWVATLSV
ncbi:alpha/beta hydrolase [Phanerochaete sordida]|uniref:Alpha/beta hydrolase n=1 Tax=Phanerochaete sordida TaxID=48140 RepID=A0A9P3GGY3_9APHY|nr:alpha/beta hydrolase [Phanerochaete sordida]